jgi:hypothetical protein
MNHEAETWRPVVGYEGWYEVSDHGRVRRVRGATAGHIRAVDVGRFGYCSVGLWKNGHKKRAFIHSLVLEAFVGSRPAKHTCNHKDGDKANNRPSNLEWVTMGANHLHAFRTGLREPNHGERHPIAKLTTDQVLEIRRLAGLELGKSLAERYGVTKQTISKIQRGQRWSHL